MFLRVKGTQDFLDMRLFNFVIATVSEHLRLYNFTQITTPIIEESALFKRSLGIETDVVSKEMFIIPARVSGDAELCLRPEATAPIVRAFIEHNIQETPWKVFTWGPMFRYERPQKGRFRQFHQVSMEIIGAPVIAQDVQFITMLDRLFHEKFQLKDYALLINFLGCQQDRQRYNQVLKAFLDTVVGMCELCMVRKDKNILRIFDCKNAECQRLYEQAPRTVDTLCTTCCQEWQQLQDQLQMLSVSYSYQPTLVRGLDYYSKTVFEFVSNALGAQTAFCGGGRYDHLVTMLAGKEDQPSLGAGIGVERLMLLVPPLYAQQQTVEAKLYVVIPIARAQESLALLIADELLARNLCTEVCLGGTSVKSMLRKANKLGAAFCIMLGEQEQQTGSVTVKNMMTGKEDVVKQVELLSFLQQ